MQKNMIDLRRELPDVSSVDGWLSELDCILMHRLLWLQSDIGILGDALEIGAYRGKSAIVIASALGSAETLHVCDLFEQEPEHESNRAEHQFWYPELQRCQFEANLRRAGVRPAVVHQCDSRVLGLRLDPTSFRYVHLDGAHVADIAEVDIVTTLTACLDDALVVLDDHVNTRFPELVATIWAAVRARRLHPLLITPNKLYTTIRADSQLRSFALEIVQLDSRLLTAKSNYHGLPALTVYGLENGEGSTASLRSLRAQFPGALRRSARFHAARLSARGWPGRRDSSS